MQEVTCQCGWRCRGTQDEVVAQVQAHGREAHGVDTTREEILAIARPVEAG
jgi:predicted small metal-binding protein